MFAAYCEIGGPPEDLSTQVRFISAHTVRNLPVCIQLPIGVRIEERQTKIRVGFMLLDKEPKQVS